MSSGVQNIPNIAGEQYSSNFLKNKLIIEFAIPVALKVTESPLERAVFVLTLLSESCPKLPGSIDDMGTLIRAKIERLPLGEGLVGDLRSDIVRLPTTNESGGSRLVYINSEGSKSPH